jgi:hypothetical protein
LAVSKSHRIPVKIGQLRYLLSLEPFRDQAALARKLGTSARYVRWMLSGEKPGYKHSGKIWKLYQTHRRKGTPVKPPKRLPLPKRKFVSSVAVVSVLRYLFQPTDAEKIPGKDRVWIDRVSRFAATEQKVRGKFDSWDGFAIVMVQGASDTGSISIRRYRPKGGAQHHLDFSEERELSDEAEMEPDSEVVDMLAERWAMMPEKHRAVLSYLPIEEWIDTIAENVTGGEVIFNFWISRFSERPTPGAYGLARDPNDPETFEVVQSVARENVDSATSDSEHFQYDLVGLYAFTGWNKKAGVKPPRQ